ncbi:MAG: aminoacyl-tRNA hydrolase [Acidobacteria bacterium]|nr:aminoacyl-tRNA hydrolase [Acidobacteriota bacterium]
MSGARVNEDGSLHVRARLSIPAREVELRVTTSGGPGGQHANRSLTKVVACFDVSSSTVLSDVDRAVLLERVGRQVCASSGRFRSQSANRAAALDSLAHKIGAVLVRQPPRRATRPTLGSQVRRVAAKRARSQIKQGRRVVED